MGMWGDVSIGEADPMEGKAGKGVGGGLKETPNATYVKCARKAVYVQASPATFSVILRKDYSRNLVWCTGWRRGGGVRHVVFRRCHLNKLPG